MCSIHVLFVYLTLSSFRLFQEDLKAQLPPLNPNLARDAELERLRRERVELEERQERAHEEVVALRRRIRQNEVEAAEERAEADRHIKAVQERLREAEQQAEEAAKELQVDVSVDPNVILHDDSGIDELLFGEINFPQLLSDFDHEEVVENFNPDIFDLV